MHTMEGENNNHHGMHPDLADNTSPDHSLEHLTLRLDDNDELSALTLTALLNSGVEEALSNLSPAQLIQLEKNVQKLKKQKNPTPSAGMAPRAPKRPTSASQDGDEHGDSPRQGDKKIKKVSTPQDMSAGQYMNLPASAPHVDIKDGVELLYFTYSTKGHVQEYCIRIDIDDLTLDMIPEDFKNDNCVYPRALATRETYTGNRYDYETNVNDLAWRLAWVNADILGGKRGLIQRAVDSYRNRTIESRSRRVLRQQKMHEGILRRRHHSPSDEQHHHDDSGHLAPQRMHHAPRSITLQYTSKTGEMSKMKLRVDIENVNLDDIQSDFRAVNCLYPQAMLEDYGSSGSSRDAYERSSNEIGWKLAYLNASKIAEMPHLLHKAVEAYRARFEGGMSMVHDLQALSGNSPYHNSAPMHIDPATGEPMMMMGSASNKSGTDFSQMVAHTLQQVLGQHDDDLHSQVSLEDHLAAVSDHLGSVDDDEDRPRTMSTADLLGGI